MARGVLEVDRLAELAGLVSALAVGVSTLALRPPLPWLWWACYVIFLGLLVGGRRIRTQRAGRTWLVALSASAVAVCWLAPSWSFAAVCLVIAAGSAPYVLGQPGTLVLLAAQTVALAGAQLTTGAAGSIVLTVTAVFAAFQLFAALTGLGAIREATARSALAEANDELRAAQALLRESARAGERLRISRDLHDLVGHQLTALVLELEVASHHAIDEATEHIGRAQRTARELLVDLRRAVSALRTSTTDVSAALTGTVRGIAHPQVHLRIDPDLEIADPEHAHTLVRCVQEIVTNAIRHAGADNLWIAIGRDGGAVTVQSHDDGHGATTVRPGNGLTGMRERLEQLGGRLSYHTEPGRGFRLEATLPAP